MAATESGKFSVMPGRAVDDARLGDAAFRLLAALGTYGNQAGYCWPTQGTLAARAGIRRQSVNRQLQTLEETGYVQIIRDEGEKAAIIQRYARHRSSVSGCLYRIIFDAEPAEAERESCDDLGVASGCAVGSENRSESGSTDGLFDSANGVQRSASPPPEWEGGVTPALQGVQRSASGGAAPGASGGAAQGADTERTSERTSEVARAGSGEEGELGPTFRSAVARLTAEGFAELEAISLANRRGVAQVDVALANLAWKVEHGGVTDRRGYIVRCITEGWTRKPLPRAARRLGEAVQRSEQSREAAMRRASDLQSHDSMLKAERAELFAFIDNLSGDAFLAAAGAVIEQSPFLRPAAGIEWRRSRTLCIAIKRQLSARELPVMAGVEAATC